MRFFLSFTKYFRLPQPNRTVTIEMADQESLFWIGLMGLFLKALTNNLFLSVSKEVLPSWLKWIWLLKWLLCLLDMTITAAFSSWPVQSKAIGSINVTSLCHLHLNWLQLQTHTPYLFPNYMAAAVAWSAVSQQESPRGILIAESWSFLDLRQMARFLTDPFI